MNKLILITAIFLQASVAFGQIFNQKNAQLRRLAEQIAALEVYKGYVKTGYNIARGGINTIRDIKNGDLNLHRTFFNSLKAVNPKIKKYQKITDIILMQIKMIQSCRNTLKYIRQSGMFGEQDIEFIKRTLDRILKNCADSIYELTDLVTDGKMEMKDDERIQRIDSIYLEVLDSYTFNESLNTEVLQMAINRHQSQMEVEFEKSLHGLK